MRVACSRHGKPDIDILRKTPQAGAFDWLHTVAWAAVKFGVTFLSIKALLFAHHR